MMLLLLVATGAVSLLYVRSRFWIVELSREVMARQETKTKLEQQRRSLTLELATLRDPRRIERVASDRLGLTRPSDMKSVVLVREGSRELP